MKKALPYYLTAFILTVLFSFLQWLDHPLVQEHIESKTYDFRLRIRNFIRAEKVPDDVIIVAVDEKSIKDMGRWPWGRDTMSLLVKRISEGHPKVIGIDIMFTERENSENDAKLAGALKDAGNVVLATPFMVSAGDQKKTASEGDIPDYLWDSAFMEVRSQQGINWKKWAIKPESCNPPLEELAKVSSLGHVYSQPDRDGVIRWEPLYLNFKEDCYPQLSLQVARIALGLEMKDMVLFPGSGVKLGERYINTDLHGRVLINYMGKEYTFPYISAADVIRGVIPHDMFRNKIVFVGTSALATYDQKITPFSANMPGVEKNANVVVNILSNNFIRKSPGILELLVIILTGIFLGFTLPRLKAVLSASFAVSFITFYIILSCYLLIYEQLWVNLVYPVVNMFGIFAVQTVLRFFREEKKAKEIRKMFSSYVSPKIVKELMDNPDKAKLGGERRVVTVLFSDVIGFTSLSEKKQPEQVVALLNEYLQEMTDIIFQWDGTLDKFVGDEIMAFWGAPAEQPNHAELAVRCALHMSDRLDELQQAWREKGGDILDCGIGINTGEVLIGNIGAQGKKMDYTVIGDHINLASRVEKLTRQYSTRVLITENTLNNIKSILSDGLLGHCDVRDLAAVKVKGKEQEIRIFEVIGRKQL